MATRYAIQQFAELMESKLAANDHKPCWTTVGFEYLFKRLIEEMSELYEAHSRALEPIDIANECADVANFAMMIADNEYFKIGRG